MEFPGFRCFRLADMQYGTIKEGRDAEITIDFMPELSADEFRELLLENEKEPAPIKMTESFLSDLFPEKLIQGSFAGQKDLVRAIKSLTLDSNRQSVFCTGPGMFRRGGYQGDSFPYYGIQRKCQEPVYYRRASGYRRNLRRL